ncbi:MAG: GNAT family N-acetyltransferase [Gammaproteobacteria bacterium]
MLAGLVGEHIEQGLPFRSWNTSRLARHLRAPDAIARIARIDGRLAGFGMLRSAGQESHLDLLLTLPPYRRCGVARRLLDALCAHAVDTGASRVTLEVRERNIGAITFYRSLGFRLKARVPDYYCGIEAALRYERAVGV